jgi:hypothetical protein
MLKLRHRTLLLFFPVYRCEQTDCPLVRKPYRYELEGRMALPYTKYSLSVMCKAAVLSRSAGGIAPLKRLLGKIHIGVPLTSLPTLLSRYEALLSGQYLSDVGIRRTFETQGCVILDVFSVRELYGLSVSHWGVQELLSSTLLGLRQAEYTDTPRELLDFITDVGRTMPVPVIGFTTDDTYKSSTVLQLLLKYSDKGRTRFCQIPKYVNPNPALYRRRLTRMVQAFHEHRNGEVRWPRKAPVPRTSTESNDDLPDDTARPGAEDLALAEIHPQIAQWFELLDDWSRAGDEFREGDSNYNYNWDFYK